MAIADTSINKAENHHQKEESQTQKGIVMPSIQKEEESCKPRSNKDEDSTSKESFNTSNHNQRTVENDSILAGATNYIRKQKNYSQDTLEIYQKKEAETKSRDPSTILFPKWHDANSYKDEKGHKNRIESILEEGGCQMSDGRNTLNRHQKKGSGNSNKGNDLT